MRWYKSFYRCYIDAHDNPDFQFAYKAFRPPSLPPISGPGPSDRFRRPHLSPGQAPMIGFAPPSGSNTPSV